MNGLTISSLSPGLPIDALSRTLGRIAAWLLLPVCTFLLSDMFWKVYYPDTLALEQSSNAIGQLGQPKPSESSASWEWFKLREAPKPKPVKIAKIKADLLGILGVGESGTAMIKLDGKAAKLYKIGAELKEGVFLSRLEHDHVILLRGESEEILALKKRDNLFSEKQQVAAASKGATKSAPAAGSLPEIVSVIKENPLKISEMVEFETVDTERYGTGVKISPVTTSEYDLLAKLNLYPGDIVLGIARKQVSDIMAKPQDFAKILDSREVKIQYMRDGKLESTVVQFNE